MKTNKAIGAGVGAAIASAITAGLSTYLGHPLDPYVTGAITAGLAWIVTYFTPANAT